jgi:signal transduction histidine kinase
MASGIAHDFNNALAAIIGFSELLLARPEALDDKETVAEQVQLINTAAQDAATVVSRLREFYRSSGRQEQFTPIDLGALVSQVMALSQPKWKDQAQAAGVTIGVDVDLDPIDPFPGHEGELREALTNLIFNAVDAMPQGGEILIRAFTDGRTQWCRWPTRGSA